MEGTKALLVEAAAETAVGWPEGETPPGRMSRRRSASGRVHGLKALVWGMQRGAKLPPCQDERAVRRTVARVHRAHLARERYSEDFLFAFSPAGQTRSINLR